MNDKIKKLSEPFGDSEIEWRIGSTTKDKKKGMLLPYVTNRAIMNRLDEVLGWNNWKQEFREIHKGIVCALSIRIDVDKEWITKEDGADVTNIEATKGGLSDSMKRAAVQFGIGRYLYEAESVWVELNDYGQPKTKPTTVTFKTKPPKKVEITIEDAFKFLRATSTLEELANCFKSFSLAVKSDPEVIALKDELKAQYT